MVEVVDDIEAVGVGIIENFTTYEVEDPQGNILIQPLAVTVSDEPMNISAYVRKDYGDNAFGDFRHDLKISWINADTATILGPWAISNGSSNYAEMVANNDGIGLELFRVSDGSSYRLRIIDFATLTATHWEVPSLPFTCWVTVERIGAIATLKIYSDPGRQTLLRTRTISCAAVPYRYLFGHYSYRWGLAEATSSAVIEDLRRIQ